MPTVRITFEKNDCMSCPIGSYIQENFYDYVGNDATCEFCSEMGKYKEKVEERECSNCEHYRWSCIIEQYFARFLEKIEVRDEVDITKLQKCLALSCFKYIKKG